MLVKLSFQTKKSEEDVFFVGKVLSVEDEEHLLIDFLRIKSPLLKDTFHFPTIRDVEAVEKSKVLGVLGVSKGVTQRQADLIKIFPPLKDFNMH